MTVVLIAVSIVFAFVAIVSAMRAHDQAGDRQRERFLKLKQMTPGDWAKLDQTTKCLAQSTVPDTLSSASGKTSHDSARSRTQIEEPQAQSWVTESQKETGHPSDGQARTREGGSELQV